MLKLCASNPVGSSYTSSNTQPPKIFSTRTEAAFAPPSASSTSQLPTQKSSRRCSGVSHRLGCASAPVTRPASTSPATRKLIVTSVLPELQSPAAPRRAPQDQTSSPIGCAYPSAPHTGRPPGVERHLLLVCT